MLDSRPSPRLFCQYPLAAGKLLTARPGEGTMLLTCANRPKDKNLKKIGTFELANIDQGLDAFLLRGFTTALQRSENELSALTALARKELFNPQHHLNVKL